jgi:hypothetical protein
MHDLYVCYIVATTVVLNMFWPLCIHTHLTNLLSISFSHDDVKQLCLLRHLQSQFLTFVIRVARPCIATVEVVYKFSYSNLGDCQ